MPPPPDPEPPGAAAAARRWRPGLRAQLLLLLVPAMSLLFAIDSWGDYRALKATIEGAYDEALLEALATLDDGVHLDRTGRVELTIPFSAQPVPGPDEPRQKYLFVGIAPQDRASGLYPEERVLLGEGEMPAPLPGTELASEPAGFGFGNAHGAAVVFYDAVHRGVPVRVAALQRELLDGTGRHYRLRVQAAENTLRRDETRQLSLRRELLQDARMLAITVALVWLGIALALRPLQRLRASLRERDAHNLQPLDASGVPVEVAPLVDAVNHHIADYRQLLGEQGRFLADASHQLRTPLAIMMTQASYALREQDPAYLRETLQAINAQLARSRRLSDQLLAMAHASRAGADADAPPLADLNAVAREVVLQYLPLAHEKDIDLGWDDVRGEDAPEDGGDENAAGASEPAAPVRAQAAELHEALANLLHNAIRHTPLGGSITVAVRMEADSALAEVRDSGPGIAPGRREAVFERFARGPGTLVPDATGAGLGLAIARAYARRNGGDIVLRDNPGGPGLCAQLRLPRAGTAQEAHAAAPA